MEGGRSVAERSSWRSWLRSSMGGVRSAMLNWNQSSHREPTRRAVSSRQETMLGCTDLRRNVFYDQHGEI